MGIFGIKANPADINPGKGASLERRINRYKDVLATIKRAEKRGNYDRAIKFQKEADALSENLLKERAAIEEMLAVNGAGQGE